MKIAFIAAFILLALAGPSRAATSFGAPAELAGLDYPEPRVYLETQDWWQEGGFDAATPSLESFAFGSVHVHMGINFPLREIFHLPPAGQGLNWDYLAQWHENVGATVRQVRGGGAGFSGTCSDTSIPSDPAYKGVKVVDVNQRHAGFIPYSAVKINCWRDEVGPREYRFTADTTSRFGKREYQSFGAFTCFAVASCAPGGVTARGWYEGPGYTNVTLKNAVSAHALAAGTVLQPGSSVSYSLAQGAAWGFALIDSDIHHGVLGIVAKPLTKASSGSFVMPALEPGVHVLLLGGIEPVSGGKANGGILRIPFLVN